MTDDKAWEKAKRREIWSRERLKVAELKAKLDRGEIDFRTYNDALVNAALDCVFESLPFRTYLP